MLKKLTLAYYRRFPTDQMIDDLQVDYIHPPHGIDETNHLLPHSHLWDQLKWETIDYLKHERVMYIRFMNDLHLENLIERGKAVRYHIHGKEGVSIAQENAYLANKYRKSIRRLADCFFVAGIIGVMTGLTLILQPFV